MCWSRKPVYRKVSRVQIPFSAPRKGKEKSFIDFSFSLLIIELYYRKLDESIAKQYFRITDVYSNCDATRYCGVVSSNLIYEHSE